MAALTVMLPELAFWFLSTIVTVTHSIERGLAIADRVVILANGQLVFEAAAAGLSPAGFRPLYDRYVGGGR